MKCARVSVLIVVTLLLNANVLGASDSSLTKVPALLTGDRTLTLAESICLALDNQASIREAQAQVLSETGSVSIAHSGLLPSTTLTTSLEQFGGSGSGRPQILVTSNQLIYDFGRTPQLVRETRDERAASLQSVSATVEDTVFNVKQAYYTLLEDQHLVDVNAENLVDQQGHLAETKAQETAGTVPHTNVLLAETSVAQARVALVTAQNTAAQARLNLSVAMGIDIRSKYRITETAEPDSTLPSEEQAIALALARRSEIKRDCDLLSAAQAGLKSTRAGYLPAVTAGVSVTPNPSGGSGPGQPNPLQISLGLQWPIFDQGAIRGTVQQARAQIVTATETLYNDQQTIENEVEQARLNIQAAEAALDYATTGVISARANLDSAVGSYQAGVGIFLAVTDAQALLLQAQVAEFTARYGLSIARAMLQHATGGDVPYGREIVAHASTLK